MRLSIIYIHVYVHAHTHRLKHHISVMLCSIYIFLLIGKYIMAVDVAYFFTPLVLLLMPEHCHDEFFVKFNFFDGK